MLNKQIQFREKVLWTAITLFIFLVCCQVSVTVNYSCLVVLFYYYINYCNYQLRMAMQILMIIVFNFFEYKKIKTLLNYKLSVFNNVI